MSLETVIDAVATQLAKQRCRSVDRIDALMPSCRYRGADGAMCAVGALVPDNLICLAAEGQGVRSIMHYHEPIKNFLVSLLPEYDEEQVIDVLSAFQVFHDRERFDSVDRAIYGVSNTYTNLIETYKSRTEEQFKAALVENLTAIANRKARAK